MLVQNGISSCLLVKSPAQTGTQAAATAIPPWWVLGLPSGGRHTDNKHSHVKAGSHRRISDNIEDNTATSHSGACR